MSLPITVEPARVVHGFFGRGAIVTLDREPGRVWVKFDIDDFGERCIWLRDLQAERVGSRLPEDVSLAS